MTEREPYSHSYGVDHNFIHVLEQTDETKRVASLALVNAGDYPTGDAPKALAWLISKAVPMTMRVHTKDPEDGGCSCVEQGWSCPDGDGPPELCWEWDNADVQEYEERSQAEFEAAPAAVSS